MKPCTPTLQCRSNSPLFSSLTFPGKFVFLLLFFGGWFREFRLKFSLHSFESRFAYPFADTRYQVNVYRPLQRTITISSECLLTSLPNLKHKYFLLWFFKRIWNYTKSFIDSYPAPFRYHQISEPKRGEGQLAKKPIFHGRLSRIQKRGTDEAMAFLLSELIKAYGLLSN